MKKKVEEVAESIDRLITVDIAARGVIYKLYSAVRDLMKEPLTLIAARRSIEVVKPNDHVFIVTGFRVPPNYIQETDGPIGAAALARALSLGLKAKPFLFIEEEAKDILISTVSGMGLKYVSKESKESKELHELGQVMVVGLPTDKEKAITIMDDLLNKYSPSILLFIEKAGRNEKGFCHTMRGFNVTPYHAYAEYMLERVSKQGSLTIGIGDGGNEVGMGKIKDTVKNFVPYGRECQCPCKGGIAAESSTDILVVATVSNWGGYGIEACLAHLINEPKLMHDPSMEERAIELAVKAGAIDGVTGLAEPSVDGMFKDIHSSIVRILYEIIKK